MGQRPFVLLYTNQPLPRKQSEPPGFCGFPSCEWRKEVLLCKTIVIQRAHIGNKLSFELKYI